MSKEKLTRSLQSTGLVTPQKAEEIAGQFAEKRIPKYEFFLTEGKVSNEYLFLRHPRSSNLPSTSPTAPFYISLLSGYRVVSYRWYYCHIWRR